METKTCGNCGALKNLEAFGLKKAGQRQSKCKSCQREYAKQHYKNNKDYYKTKGAKARKKLVASNKLYLLSYLSKNPCIDCGEADIEVLEFDHKKQTPEQRVSHLIGSSRARLEKEIALCDVRCANCHVRRTRKQLGTSRR